MFPKQFGNILFLLCFLLWLIKVFRFQRKTFLLFFGFFFSIIIRAFRLRSKRPIAILFFYYYYYSFSGHITVEGSGKSIECM